MKRFADSEKGIASSLDLKDADARRAARMERFGATAIEEARKQSGDRKKTFQKRHGHKKLNKGGPNKRFKKD
jgi:hypothetical protein